MTVYAGRLQNGQDTADRVRRFDALTLASHWDGQNLAKGGIKYDSTRGNVAVVDGTMTVTVEPFSAWIDARTNPSQGGYPFVSDSQVVLTISPGHATLDRIDTVIAEVRHDVHDGSGFTDARVRILEGTPGGASPIVPDAAIPLRNINVHAGASTGTGGLSSANLGNDRRTYTAALGGIVPVRDGSDQALVAHMPGDVTYRLDTDTLEVWDGFAWLQVATVPDEDPWHIVGAAGEPPFENGWENAPGTSVKFRKDTAGNVHIAGLPRWTIAGGPSTVFTLPPGYRPNYDASAVTTGDQAGTFASTDVLAGTGEVRSNDRAGAPAYRRLDIVFSAQQ